MPLLSGISSSQGHALAKMLAEQCRYWDATARQIAVPEARLWMAVVEQSLAELPQRFERMPKRDEYANAKKYQSALNTWQQRQTEAAAAWDFLMTERFDVYADLLGLNASWVRSKILNWMKLSGSTQPVG